MIGDPDTLVQALWTIARLVSEDWDVGDCTPMLVLEMKLYLRLKDLLAYHLPAIEAHSLRILE
jgi:hypothetical protein